MPRANDNRKPVGTETCLKCGEEAEFYQVQQGPYLGYLYRKGCECKADQRRKPYVQFEMLERMRRTPHPMMEHPLTRQGEHREKPAQSEPEPKPETRTTSEEAGETPNHRGAIIGGLILIGGIAAALFT